MKTLVYPGSFDPITLGHIDIIERASKLCENLIVLIAENPHKNPLFTTGEKLEMINKVIVNKKLANVSVDTFKGLTVDYAKSKNATLVRGLRNVNDFENEYTIFSFNRDLCEEIDTIILFPTSVGRFVSASAVKELAINGADVSHYIPKEVVPYLKKKLSK